MARRDGRERRAMFERGAAPPAPGSPKRQPRWGEAGMHRRPNAAGPSPRAASGGGGSAALVVIAAWTLFAFAGAYAWTTVPLVCGAVVLAIRERPPIGRGSHRILDGMLIVWILLAAAALVPLPTSVRLTISPHAATVDRALYLDATTDPAAGRARPLSMDWGETASALVIVITIALVFWCARAVVARRGLRGTIRGIAWMGLALSALTLIQRATAPRLLYWYWHPISTHAMPYGPYVNRNSLATWLIMAIPATIGYGVARFQSRRSVAGSVDLESGFDATALWLAASVCLMQALLLVVMSRAGLTGGVVGLICLMWLARGRIAASRWRWLAAILLALLSVAMTYANWGALANRVNETVTLGLDGRREIWQLTWRIVRDFPLVGVGVGAYARAMSVYQPVPHAFYINDAHNQYLQLLTEGGAILAVPAALAAATAAVQIARRLRGDRTAVFWIRAGAASGLIAVAVQGMWQVSMTPPANAVLFAILAAVALHDGSVRPTAKHGRPSWSGLPSAEPHGPRQRGSPDRNHRPIASAIAA
jgi:O-antigen ligase